MKRAGDGAGGGAPKRGRAPRTGQFAFKVLCPEPLVASVVGSNGATVTKIQEESGAHLTFSRRGDFYPGSRLRVLVISAGAPGEILRALEEVIEVVAFCGEEERQVLEGAGTLEDDDGEFVDASGDYRLRCALSASAAEAALEPDGGGLESLCEETGASILIDGEVIEGHQLATLGGDKPRLVAAFERLSSLVQADVEEPWFSDWADQRGFAEPGGAGRDASGGAGERRRGGRDGGEPPRRGEGGGHPGQMGLTIFVGGLTQATQASALRAHFDRYGRVVEADVKMDSRTGRSKGFGFVTFADARAVDRCFERPSEHVVGGKWVEVKRYGDAGGEGARPPDPAPRSRPAGQRSPEREEPRGRGRGSPRRGSPRRGSPRRGSPRRGSPRRGGSGGGPRGERPPAGPAGVGIGRFTELARAVPAGYLELDYCISCSLPGAQCGALIGRRGENVAEVERRTGARIQLSKKDPGSEHRQLSIVGDLLSVYAAHLLLMRDFNEAVAQPVAQPVAQRPDADAARPGAGATQQIEQLQRQLDMLRSQVGTRRGA